MSSQSSNIDPAVFSITTTPSTAYTVGMVSITYGGSGYEPGNFFVVRGDLLGGTSPTNDLTIRVDTVNALGAIQSETVAGTSSANATTIVVTMDMAFGPNFLRDASDRTRALRERLIYNEKRAGTNITPGTPGLGRGHAETLWQQQGNNFRMAYLAGKLKCGAAFGGAYNLNGPNSFNSSGQQSGS